jgi:hypothetical protein
MTVPVTPPLDNPPVEIIGDEPRLTHEAARVLLRILLAADEARDPVEDEVTLVAS